MKLFLDSANVKEIREINDYGVVRGVATNPSLIAREGREFTGIVSEIAEIVDGTVFAGVVSPGRDKMILEAHELIKLGNRLEIQVPMCAEGLKAISTLKKEGVRTNCTLVFTAAQALLAVLVGASYVTAFIDRLGDSGVDGVKLIADIAEIFRQSGADCEIVASGLQSPMHVVECAKAGAHIVAVPPQVVRQMIGHPLTDDGVRKFAADWEELFSRL